MSPDMSPAMSPAMSPGVVLSRWRRPPAHPRVLRVLSGAVRATAALPEGLAEIGGTEVPVRGVAVRTVAALELLNYR